jgi:hypothetical protein
MYRDFYPLCKQKDEDVSFEDRKEDEIELPSGSKVKVTRFSDGSSTVHWGGPCGDSQYNDLGEEC